MIKNALIGGVDRLNGEPADAINQNETENAIINASLKGQAQIPFSILKSAGAFTNEGHLCADRITDANGLNNTINTGSSTAVYDTINDYYLLGFIDEASGDTTHDPDTFTNPNNAFDNNNNTAATKTFATSATISYSLGKTFGVKFVSSIKYKITNTDDDAKEDAFLQTFNGSVWSNVLTITGGNGEGIFVLESIVQGVRINFNRTGAGSSGTFSLFSLEYGDFDTSSTIIADTNTLTLDGTETTLTLYNDAVIPTDTSMSIVISDGVNSTSSYPLGAKTSTVIPISSLSSGTLKMTFTLATTDTSVTPTWSGYGVVIAK